MNSKIKCRQHGYRLFIFIYCKNNETLDTSLFKSTSTVTNVVKLDFISKKFLFAEAQVHM
jgi:hypothetical protein